ncbi:mandelate racemase/muconate lactonizing enzyme family protein [Kitasatospora sp. NA04385]|uniref:mandelate racemase/muconate lactonizing enzyme family protein n=1 Tax=Kitasatospora sp. NA04385 TaxID=2742135 RepID=UPI00159108A4|nr:mandelate racemase/muconate lactonizing enzyme family protein [Kitasatospora sp. NA04385]QKW17784.1 mandelate racemase/muconate lactonizing enzyme family protein [Kitasatospora sp. NA04385]
MKITQVSGYVLKVKDAAYLGGHDADASALRRGDYVRHRSYRSLYSLNTETFLVRVTAEDGTVGWGEAQAPLVPEVCAALVERLIGPFLLGADVMDTGAAWRSGYDGMRERGHLNGYQLDALAACDIALWDVKAKLLGVPVHALLGGRHRADVPCYVSGLPARDDAERVDRARSWRDRGFDRFKLALGEGIDHDVRVFESLRTGLGGDAEIHVDAHWRYTPSEAIGLGRRLEPMGLGFLEAPVAPEDADGQAEVAAALVAPVAVGEELRTRYDFRDRLVRRSADLLQPDVGRMGLTECAAAASLAEAFHTPIALHLGVGLGVYIAAGLALAAAAPNLVVMEYQPTQFALAQTLLREPLACDGGSYRLPGGSGLGVDVDDEALRRHCTASFTLTTEDL